MFKKILTFFLALFVAAQPLVAAAGDLDAAFGNLLGPGAAVAVNNPGHYQSGARNSFVAGGLEMRVPHASSSPQLFSVTPPNVTAGCNGISAHFGGFSFISGQEFEQMLKSIASGAALGFVSMMVMKTMCPPCEAVVQFLKTAAQQAARLSKDSCQWGQELAQKYMAGDSSGGDPISVCGTTISGSGTSSDFLKATNEGCKSVVSAVDALKGENSATASSPDGKALLQCETQAGSGNATWRRLSAFDASGTTTAEKGTDAYKRKLLLLNLLGAELGQDGSDSEVSYETEGGTITLGEKKPHDYATPRLSPENAVALFMCGTPGAATTTSTGAAQSRVAEYCASFYANKTSGATTGGALSDLSATKVYACDDEAATCQVLKLKDANTVLAGGTGFLVNVNSLLQQGVDAVRTNNKMPDDVIRLMQVAPYPLYQAINAAAVYPAAADDLIDSMSILVAEQAAVAYLDDALRLPGGPNAAGKGCLSQPQAEQILKAVGTMRAANKSRKVEIGQNITMQEALTEQIRQINLTIQKQVMTQDMLATGRYAQSVNNALAPNVSKDSTTAASGSTTP
jgi:hypothetical protein